MAIKEEITGLCINCNNKENCSYRVSIKDPVVCCEEYDAYMPEQQINANMYQENSNFETRVDVMSYSNEFKGLCINCENNSTCTISKLPGGIWHCEEYR